MAESELEILFLSYRQRGEASALAEVFDRTAPELLRLAMHLVRDSVEAEDVLQATYLAAIEGADSFDGTRALMPWLTGILARQAGLVRRRARRVIEPDRLDERSSVDPAQIVEAHEFSTELRLALEALPDTYRDVVRLHLADGKRSVDIARDLGRAPGTVRMQMHRGLELLRRALPAGFAAGTLGTFGATRGLAAVRADVLAVASQQGAAGPGSGCTSATGLGGIAGGVKLALLALCVLGLVAGQRWETSSPRSESQPAGPTVLAELTREVAGPAASFMPEQASRQALEVGEPAPLATPARAGLLLRGSITGLEPHELSAVHIRVSALARFAWPKELVLPAQALEDGSFELDVASLFAAARPARPLEALVVEVDHPDHLAARAQLDLHGPVHAAYDVAIALEPAACLVGRVLSPEGRVAPGVTVALFASRDGGLNPQAIDCTRTADDGSFRLRARESADFVLLAHGGDWRPLTLRVGMQVGRLSDVGRLSMQIGELIEGRFTQSGNLQGHGALVSASTTAKGTWVALAGRRYLWNGQHFERGGAIVECDAHGQFRIAGLEAQVYRVGPARAGGEVESTRQRLALLSTVAHSQIEAPARGVLLQQEVASVELQVRANESQQRREATFATLHLSQGERRIDFHVALGETVALSLVPRQACSLRIECPGFTPQEQAFEAPAAGLIAGQTFVLLRQPVAARLQIQLSAPEGDSTAALGAATFAFHARGSGASQPADFVRHAVGLEGRFDLDELPAGEWTLRAHVGGVYEHYRDFWCVAERDLHLVAGAQATCGLALVRGGRLQVDALDSTRARLGAACELYDPRGERIDVEFIARSPHGAQANRSKLGAATASEVHPILPVGSYEVRLSAPGFVAQTRRVQINPGVVFDLAALLLPLEQRQ